MTTSHHTPNPYALPVVIVGTVALDISRLWNEARTAHQVRVDVGGVCKHVACALGNLGVSPRFVTTRFSGELGVQLPGLLRANHVEWQPLAAYAPVSLFEADLDVHDEVFAESFVEGESLELLTPGALRSHAAFAGARVIVSCTNLSVAALDELAEIAGQGDARFWLLNSSALDTPKIRQIKHTLDLISLNVEELERLVGRPLETLQQISAAALDVTPTTDKCLVTLGSRGALLCQQGVGDALYHPVEPIMGRSPVGGGDVLFAGLLAGKIRNLSWEDAFALGANSARNYLLRDPNSAAPYAGLARASDRPLPPIERIPLIYGA